MARRRDQGAAHAGSGPAGRVTDEKGRFWRTPSPAHRRFSSTTVPNGPPTDPNGPPTDPNGPTTDPNGTTTAAIGAGRQHDLPCFSGRRVLKPMCELQATMRSLGAWNPR